MIALAVLIAYLAPFGLASEGHTQQLGTPQRIGVLLVGFTPEGKPAHAFREALRDAGYAEGRDVVIEWRTADGDVDRIPELVADLVKSKVDVIVVDTTIAAQSFKPATSTIPIVLAMVSDPVASGLVTNLARPNVGTKKRSHPHEFESPIHSFTISNVT